MKILLVRHGKTDLNKERRYCGGKTDIPLCEEGRKMLEERVYPEVEKVYSSPMIRCLETADIVFGCKTPIVIEAMRECDFGDLEEKTDGECKGDPVYDSFVESGGTLPFPGGESLVEFDARVKKGFYDLVCKLMEETTDGIVGLVVHGGTIMSIMSTLVPTSGGFYDYNVQNGEGYLIQINEEEWRKGERYATILSGVDTGIYS